MHSPSEFSRAQILQSYVLHHGRSGEMFLPIKNHSRRALLSAKHSCYSSPTFQVGMLLPMLSFLLVLALSQERHILPPMRSLLPRWFLIHLPAAAPSLSKLYVSVGMSLLLT